MNYPGIERAWKLICYDNGMINRYVCEDDAISGMLEMLPATRYAHCLQEIDEFLRTATDEIMEVLSTGEEFEREQMLRSIKTPFAALASGLLDELFLDWDY